jgi:hypothetical protein
MKTIFDTAMRKAAKLTRRQHVIEATRVIQRALSGRNPAASMEQPPARNLRLIEPEAGARRAARRRKCECWLAGVTANTRA